MKKNSLMSCSTSAAVVKNAMKNYETYVEHYKARNLIPMPLNEFLNNYRN